MKIAYADPPYPGMAYFYKCPEVDHAELIARLGSEYPDGWALSTASTTLQQVLALCPPDVRIGAWVKPWASFKPGVNPGYCWEPIIFTGGRMKRPKTETTIRDWCSCNATMGRRFVGAKPERMCWWLFELMGLESDDEFVDLFVGSGAVTRAWQRYQTERLFGAQPCTPNA